MLKLEVTRICFSPGVVVRACSACRCFALVNCSRYCMLMEICLYFCCFYCNYDFATYYTNIFLCKMLLWRKQTCELFHRDMVMILFLTFYFYNVVLQRTMLTIFDNLSQCHWQWWTIMENIPANIIAQSLSVKSCLRSFRSATMFFILKPSFWTWTMKSGSMTNFCREANTLSIPCW